MHQQSIGILVNADVYRRIPSGKTKQEMISFYVDAAKEYHLLPCFFRIQDVQVNARQVHAYIPNNRGKGFKRTYVPLPSIIHNRAIYLNAKMQNKVNKLNLLSSHVFNLCNRYGKLHIYDLLMQNEAIRPHLPGTVNANAATLMQYLTLYDQVIIKPNNGSIGRGIYKINRVSNKYILHYRDRNKRWRTLSFKKRPPNFLLQKFRKRRYLIQQQLSLATWQGRPFDLRVSVQRDITGHWQITGIVGKAARPNHFLTNVAQGGQVLPLSTLIEQYPHLSASEVEANLTGLTFMIVHHLEQFLPNLADLGLDLGITKDGVPLFIECNGRDLRYSFRQAGMMNEWKATYTNPISYAKFLFNQKQS